MFVLFCYALICVHSSFAIILKRRKRKLVALLFTDEACIGVLGIQDICHFTSRVIGYYPFYFQGYGILGSIFTLLLGILKI